MASIQAFAYQGIKEFTAKDDEGIYRSKVAETGQFQINCKYKTFFPLHPLR
jgi:hypothetical protein